MSNRDYRLFLHDIFESIGRIEEYTRAMDFNSFSSSPMAADADLP